MVVGMLWEVTDLEVDKVVSTLVSLYVPSEARLPWHSVGKAKWSNRILGENLLCQGLGKFRVQGESEGTGWVFSQ